MNHNYQSTAESFDLPSIEKPSRFIVNEYVIFDSGIYDIVFEIYETSTEKRFAAKKFEESKLAKQELEIIKHLRHIRS